MYVPKFLILPQECSNVISFLSLIKMAISKKFDFILSSIWWTQKLATYFLPYYFKNSIIPMLKTIYALILICIDTFWFFFYLTIFKNSRTYLPTYLPIFMKFFPQLAKYIFNYHFSNCHIVKYYGTKVNFQLNNNK